ncbi:hypothetical protein BGZ83_006448 [Gryganskiella cystojenkinii]|nr:hypothetical protein BGZ83_006448 [Gryganskiella cystojenkinii]
MHAIEWHTIQEMEDQDDTDFMIALTRRANCPVFNLSITRWLNCGLNTLELEPFNSINCFCNQPMVVSPMQSLMHPNRRPQAYDLVCRNRDIRTRTVPVTTSTRTREPQSCSRVGSIHKIRYPARQTPVHTDGLIQSDLWLQRVFGQGQPPEMYFLPASNSIDPVCDQQGLRSILHSKRFSLDFSRPPRFLSPRSASPSSGSLSKVSSVFSPDCYLHGKKNLSFREPIEEVISDGYQYNPSDGGTRTNGPPRRWAPNLWSSAQWSQSVYSSAIARPDALAILRGQTPYEEAIVLSAKFGHTRLAPETADRYLIRASDSMILWNERQETDDQVATTELTSATRTNNEAVEQVRAVHVRLVKELNRMKQNASLMPSNHKCKVCFEGFLTDILLPCGHLVLCKDCLRLVTVCPICRRSLTGKQRISWGSKIGGTELARRELNSVV